MVETNIEQKTDGGDVFSDGQKTTIKLHNGIRIDVGNRANHIVAEINRLIIQTSSIQLLSTEKDGLHRRNP